MSKIFAKLGIKNDEPPKDVIKHEFANNNHIQ